MAQRGFLLVEMLVALMVLAIVAAPLVALLVQGSHAQAAARMHTEAAAWARAGMEEVRSLGYCELESVEEELVGGGRFKRWVVVDVVGEEYELKQVEVKVQWEQQGRRQEFALKSFMGRR